ncbi:outer membrane protein assembly factor BamE [Aestuariispira insulae]|nr:outer membrane protein assembly factor BamE [Aestuariispira insulae]
MAMKTILGKFSKTTRFGLSAIAITMMTSACSPKVEQRGNMPTPFQMEQVAVGSSTKSDIQQILGSPSTVGTFDAQIWYYMSRRTEQWAFFEPEVLEQQVLVLYFDDRSVLQNMQRYTEEDLRRIALQERETPTAGHSLTVLEQMLGNFGRFR